MNTPENRLPATLSAASVPDEPDRLAVWVDGLERHAPEARTREQIENGIAACAAGETKLRLRGLDSLGNRVATVRFDLRRKLGALPELQAVPPKERGRGKTLHASKVLSPAEQTDRSRLRQIAAVPEPVVEAAKRKAATRGERLSERAVLREARKVGPPKTPPIPEAARASGLYTVILADPPWRYDYAQSDSRAVENQYPTMDLGGICALPFGSLIADDAILFIWATSPKLAESMQVVEAWGFTYRTCAVWVKDKIGMGYYFRQRHELLLIATRGDIKAPAPADRPDSVIEAPRGQHSAKPEIVHAVINRMYPGHRKIELFARRPVAGWDVWGNESE